MKRPRYAVLPTTQRFNPVNNSEIIICSDVAELNRKAAAQFIELANVAIAQAGRFAVALSGGSTPKALYALLASPEYRDRVDWSRTHLFWGDERCVPPDHAESNFRMVEEALLNKIQYSQAKSPPHGGRERAETSGGRL